MKIHQPDIETGRTRRADVRLDLSGALALGATLLFYAALIPFQETWFAAKFLARGWVPYAVAWLTAWAIVVLLFKYRVLAQDRRALGLDLLPDALGGRVTPDNADAFTAHLDALDAAPGNPLIERVRRALHHFAARRDAREVAQQLGQQAQADADAVESSYTMVRVFIWAVPILGFIGTVIGIGSAVGGFSEAVGAAADLDVMKESIGNVTSGLGVAFDTTLIALVMSILIMFPASSLQKSEEDFLAAIEDYCDERLVQRLVDDRDDDHSDPQVIQEAIAREMALHHAELRGWHERLSQIGETLTAHVVTGWEKVDEQLRLRQERQLDQLGRWAFDRQRETSEELAETQRGLMRDFRTSLEGMAAESRRIQEEGVARLDEQLAGIERLHRRLQEDQHGAASAHREQSQALASAAEQLSRTLARIRSEASEARDEGARQLSEFASGIQEIARSAQGFQQGLSELEETQVRALGESTDRLGETLQRMDARLDRVGEESAARLAESRRQLEAMEQSRGEARRRDTEVRDAQLAALASSTEMLDQTLEALRTEARTVQRGLIRVTDGIAPALAQQVESLAGELAEPWRRQLAHIEHLHARLAEMARSAEREPRASRVRRFLSRS